MRGAGPRSGGGGCVGWFVGTSRLGSSAVAPGGEGGAGLRAANWRVPQEGGNWGAGNRAKAGIGKRLRADESARCSDRQLRRPRTAISHISMTRVRRAKNEDHFPPPPPCDPRQGGGHLLASSQGRGHRRRHHPPPHNPRPSPPSTSPSLRPRHTTLCLCSAPCVFVCNPPYIQPPLPASTQPRLARQTPPQLIG